MIPVIALIGRKYVGKSTLFNRLTFTGDALVGSNALGLTRDRRYGYCNWDQYRSVIIDTGGIEMIRESKELEIAVFNQVKFAILEANLVLLIVDAQIGLLPSDRDIIQFLYKFQKSIFIVVNKVDSINSKNSQSEFYSLGIKTIIFISAIYGFGVNDLLDNIVLFFCKNNILINNNIVDNFLESPKIFSHNQLSLLNNKELDAIVLAVVGAPNVGKSTFINSVLGETRVVVSNIPGTTRDNVCVSIIYNGCKYILVDTAGMRKKNKISSVIEEVSIIRTLKIIQNVDVVLLLVSASNGISNYDLSLLNNILRTGKSVVVVVNKCDLLSNDLKEKFKIMCNTRLRFARFININFISALYGTGMSFLFKSIFCTYRSSVQSFSTSCLTRITRIAVDKCPPPRIYGKEIKLKYAHIGGCSPLVVVIHGIRVTGLSDNYKRYLTNFFLRVLQISGSSIDIRFKEIK